jgi:hypothetical protein
VSAVHQAAYGKKLTKFQYGIFLASPGRGHFRLVICDPRVKLVSLIWSIVFQTKDLEPSAGRGKYDILSDTTLNRFLTNYRLAFNCI